MGVFLTFITLHARAYNTPVPYQALTGIIVSSLAWLCPCRFKILLTQVMNKLIEAIRKRQLEFLGHPKGRPYGRFVAVGYFLFV